MDDAITIIFMFAGIFIFAGILFAAIALTKRTGRGVDVERYRSRWLTIEQQLKREDEHSYIVSVLEADKLLDHALKDKGVSGQTMGERMKKLQTTWSNANAVWAAHKLRNQIAHEANVKLDYENARRALHAFKQALKDVGVI